MRNKYYDSISINGSCDDIDVDITLEYDDVMKILKKFSPELLKHFEETFTEEQKKELNKKFSYYLDETTSADNIEFLVSVDELRNVSDEDLKYVLEDNYNEFIGSNSRVVIIPNLSAEYEFNEFYERFKSKWNL